MDLVPLEKLKNHVALEEIDKPIKIFVKLPQGKQVWIIHPKLIELTEVDIEYFIKTSRGQRVLSTGEIIDLENNLTPNLDLNRMFKPTRILSSFTINYLKLDGVDAKELLNNGNVNVNSFTEAYQGDKSGVNEFYVDRLESYTDLSINSLLKAIYTSQYPNSKKNNLVKVFDYYYLICNPTSNKNNSCNFPLEESTNLNICIDDCFITKKDFDIFIESKKQNFDIDRYPNLSEAMESLSIVGNSLWGKNYEVQHSAQKVRAKFNNHFTSEINRKTAARFIRPQEVIVDSKRVLESSKFQLLVKASSIFWKYADLNDPDTHPTDENLKTWVQAEENNDLVKSSDYQKFCDFINPMKKMN
jgi:hypothetical protein